MDVNQAKNILGLGDTYTEDELKNAYWGLIRKYHPDANIGKSEEELKELEKKAKEVNVAYEYLNKNVQIVSMSIENYIQSLYHELLKYNSSIHSADLDKYRSRIVGILFRFYCIKNRSKGEIDRLFQEAKREIKSIFEELCINYFNQYGIDLKYRSQLNFEVSIQNFYEQLEEIKKQVLLSKLSNEIKKYQKYKGYEYLKEQIETKVVDNSQARVKDVGLDQAIKMMHQEIEELFELYFKVREGFHFIKKQLEEHADKLSPVFLDKVKQKYDEIWRSFERKDALTDIEIELDDMKKDIENQIKLESQSNLYDALFKRIMLKYYESIQTYQIISDTSKIHSHTRTLEMVIQLFDLLKRGKIEFTSFMLLDNLNFADILEDANIISSVYHNLDVVDESNIYLKKDKAESVWVVLDKKDGSLIQKYYDVSGQLVECEITIAELSENYMPLDLFIKEMKPVGKIQENFGKKEKILYSNGTFVIMIAEEQLDICYVSNDFYVYDSFEIPIECQDKEYVKMKIVEMIQDKLSKDRNKSRKKSL